MKKLFLTMAFFAGAMFFTSCDEAVNEILSELTGSAAVIVGNTETSDFNASIVMQKNGSEKDASPYAIGISMRLSIDDLLTLDSSRLSQAFPFMCYRLSGNITPGNLTVDNYISAEDVLAFDYNWLLNGKFANKQLVGLAVDMEHFYVMKSGTIEITEISDNKISGSFTGTAYEIDRSEGAETFDPSGSVPFSGSFSSRSTTMFGWLVNMQSEGVEEE